MKIRRKPDPHRFLLGCRMRGWRPHDSGKDIGEQVRDATHEAFHALTVGLERWDDREAVHRALVRHLSPSALWVHEIEARVTEQRAVRRFGLETRDLEHWIGMSCMEAVRTHAPSTDPDRAMAIALRFDPARIADNVARVIRFQRFPSDRVSWED